MKILYIAGRGRSGSTLLGNVLNEIDGFVHVGELRYVWQIAFLENRKCGCGKPVQECAFWSGIIADTLNYLSDQGVTASEVASMGSSLPSHSELLFNTLLGRKPEISKTYIDSIKVFYNNLFRGIPSSTEYIVDSSKFPIHAYILKEIIGLDVCILHIVRDPRATTFSWKKHVKREDISENYSISMPRHGALKEAFKWEIWNRVIHRLFSETPSYQVVRYEDFASHPHDSVARILQLIDSDAENPVHDQSIDLSQNHVLWGNPFRMKRGKTAIYLDEKWRQSINFVDLATVSIFARQGLQKYGYE